LRAPLLHVALELRALLRREDVHHLLAELTAGLRIAGAAFRMCLLVLRLQLLDLLLLLRRKVELLQFILKEAAAPFGAVPKALLALRILRAFGLELGALVGRQHRVELSSELLHRLRIARRALRMRLAEVLNDLLDLRFLLIAQVQVVEAVHEAAAAFVLAGLSVRLGRLLRERDRRNCNCAGEYDTRNGTTDRKHRVDRSPGVGFSLK